MTLKCDNGKDCPYGPIVEDDDGNLRNTPEDAYSQQGRYYGLCLNCLDDHRRDMEFMELA